MFPDRKYHGYGGELYVGKQELSPIIEYFFKAAKEKGLKLFDMNSHHAIGLKLRWRKKFSYCYK
jgi:hypothetical protein